MNSFYHSNKKTCNFADLLLEFSSISDSSGSNAFFKPYYPTLSLFHY